MKYRLALINSILTFFIIGMIWHLPCYAQLEIDDNYKTTDINGIIPIDEQNESGIIGGTLTNNQRSQWFRIDIDTNLLDSKYVVIVSATSGYDTYGKLYVSNEGIYEQDNTRAFTCFIEDANSNRGEWDDDFVLIFTPYLQTYYLRVQIEDESNYFTQNPDKVCSFGLQYQIKNKYAWPADGMTHAVDSYYPRHGNADSSSRFYTTTWGGCYSGNWDTRNKGTSTGELIVLGNNEVRNTHDGVDIVTGISNCDIYAVAPGIVRSSFFDTAWGNVIVIEHWDLHHPSSEGQSLEFLFPEIDISFFSAYAHLSSRNVRQGDLVYPGMKIGVMGNTGTGTGVHLHFQIDKALDSRDQHLPYYSGRSGWNSVKNNTLDPLQVIEFGLCDTIETIGEVPQVREIPLNYMEIYRWLKLKIEKDETYRFELAGDTDSSNDEKMMSVFSQYPITNDALGINETKLTANREVLSATSDDFIHEQEHIAHLYITPEKSQTYFLKTFLSNPAIQASRTDSSNNDTSSKSYFLNYKKLLVGYGLDNAYLNAFRNAYRDANAVKHHHLGEPDDDGGGTAVHRWPADDLTNGVIIQNFKNINPDKRYSNTESEEDRGKSALIYNPSRQQCYLVRDGIWKLYKPSNDQIELISTQYDHFNKYLNGLFGPHDLGAPTDDQIVLSNGDKVYQTFQRGVLRGEKLPLTENEESELWRWTYESYAMNKILDVLSLYDPEDSATYATFMSATNIQKVWLVINEIYNNQNRSNRTRSIDTNSNSSLTIKWKIKNPPLGGFIDFYYSTSDKGFYKKINDNDVSVNDSGFLTWNPLELPSNSVWIQTRVLDQHKNILASDVSLLSFIELPAAGGGSYPVHISASVYPPGSGNISWETTTASQIDYSLEAGVEYTIIAQNNDGYVFDGWILNGERVSNQPNWLTYAPYEDSELIAKFIKAKIDVTLSPDRVKEIWSMDDLQTIQNDLSGNYRLMVDLDARKYPFIPLGTLAEPFQGNFNGNGHTIENLSLTTRPRDDYQGLFRYARQGNIHDLTLKKVNIVGRNFLGALVGMNDRGTILNIEIQSANISGHDFAGGLAGYHADGTVANCKSNGVVRSTFDRAGGLIGVHRGLLIKCQSDCYASSDNYVGGLVGINESGGTIERCQANGDVDNRSTCGGGLIGNNQGNVYKCKAYGAVNGTGFLGGLIGYNNGTVEESSSHGDVSGTGDEIGGLAGCNRGMISNSYARGKVHASGNHAGGLVGENSNGIVMYCYSTGNVSCGGRHAGGLIGYASTLDVEHSFWDLATSGLDISMGGNATNTISLQTPSILIEDGWDFDYETNNGENDIWSVDRFIDDGYPYHRDQLVETIEIRSMDDLQSVNNNLSADYILMQDLDASGYGFTPIAPDRNSYAAFFQGEAFTGTFDGNGHVIRNLTIRGSDYTALFGYAKAARILHLGLENVKIDGRDYTGALVGFLSCSTVDDTYEYGEVSTSGNVAGGLVGGNDNSIIIQSYASGSVTGYNKAAIGGLIGQNAGDLQNVSALSRVTGNNNVGGLIGVNHGKVSIAFASCSVFAENNAGGLIGHHAGTLTHAYAVGEILDKEGVLNLSTVGGGVGFNVGGIHNIYASNHITGTYAIGGLIGNNQGSISNSYANGFVDSKGISGGVVGTNDREGKITNLFWDIQTTGQTNGIGADNIVGSVDQPSDRGCPGKSSAEMTNNEIYVNAGWDFSMIWDWNPAIQNGYPFLQELAFSYPSNHSVLIQKAVIVCQTLDEIDAITSVPLYSCENVGGSQYVVFCAEIQTAIAKDIIDATIAWNDIFFDRVVVDEGKRITPLRSFKNPTKTWFVKLWVKLDDTGTPMSPYKIVLQVTESPGKSQTIETGLNIYIDAGIGPIPMNLSLDATPHTVSSGGHVAISTQLTGSEGNPIPDQTIRLEAGNATIQQRTGENGCVLWEFPISYFVQEGGTWPVSAYFDGSDKYPPCQTHTEFDVTIENLPDGYIDTIAGASKNDLPSPTNVPALGTYLCIPSGICIDSKGNLIFSENHKFLIRTIDKQGILTTIAGTGIRGNEGKGGPANKALLYDPRDVTIDMNDHIYFVDEKLIKRIDATTQILTIVDGYEGDSIPSGIYVDRNNQLYIVETNRHSIHKIDLNTNRLSIAAGTGKPGYNGDGISALEAQLWSPADIADDSEGNLYITDTGNHCIRKIDRNGIITTIAGIPRQSYLGSSIEENIPAVESRLYQPNRIVIDQEGTIFFSEWGDKNGGSIRCIDKSGVIHTVAFADNSKIGKWNETGEDNLLYGDGGNSRDAKIWHASTIALSDDGNLFVCDYGNQVIRMISNVYSIFPTFIHNFSIYR